MAEIKRKTMGVWLVVVAISSVLLVACGQEPPKPQVPSSVNNSVKKDIVLKSYGPENIKAGRPFIVQPNGESAMWVLGENITKDTIIVVDGVKLESSPNPDGKSITAFVPKKLFEKPGQYPLYLVDQITQKKSNEIKFIVQ